MAQRDLVALLFSEALPQKIFNEIVEAYWKKEADHPDEEEALEQMVVDVKGAGHEKLVSALPRQLLKDLAQSIDPGADKFKLVLTDYLEDNPIASLFTRNRVSDADLRTVAADFKVEAPEGATRNKLLDAIERETLRQGFIRFFSQLPKWCESLGIVKQSNSAKILGDALFHDLLKNLGADPDKISEQVEESDEDGEEEEKIAHTPKRIPKRSRESTPQAIKTEPKPKKVRKSDSVGVDTILGVVKPMRGPLQVPLTWKIKKTDGSVVALSGKELMNEAPDLMLEYIEHKIINSVNVMTPRKD